MQIIIQNQARNRIPLQVEPKEDIQSVKFKIQDVEHAAPHEQRLLFQGMHLEEGRTIESYNIQEGAVIYLTKTSD